MDTDSNEELENYFQDLADNGINEILDPQAMKYEPQTLNDLLREVNKHDDAPIDDSISFNGFIIDSLENPKLIIDTNDHNRKYYIDANKTKDARFITKLHKYQQPARIINVITTYVASHRGSNSHTLTFGDTQSSYGTIEYQQSIGNTALARISPNRYPELNEWLEEYLSLCTERGTYDNDNKKIVIKISDKLNIPRKIIKDWFIDFVDGRDTTNRDDILEIFGDYLEAPENLDWNRKYIKAVRESIWLSYDNFNWNRTMMASISDVCNRKMEEWADELGIKKSYLRAVFNMLRKENSGEFHVKKKFYDVLETGKKKKVKMK